MDNILVSLPSRVSPQALTTPVNNEGFSVGKSTFHTSLLEAFTKDVFDTSRLACLKSMSHITCEEFKKVCKDAQEQASNVDAMSGFIKAEGSVGADQYGPIRRVLNQRLSEAKQVFGVLKTDASVVAEKGWFPAVEAARFFLSSLNVKWDGSKAPTEEQKASKETRAALSEVMGENKQEANESFATYMARCASLVETKLEERAEQAKEKALLKIVSSLEKAHGKDVLASLFAYIVDVADHDSLKDMANYIYEAQVLQGKK